MPRCSSCRQSRWVHLRFHRQVHAIEWLTGCVPYRCIACPRRGWHRAHRVPPVLLLLWRAVTRLSPQPAWRRLRIAARAVRTRVSQVDLTPVRRRLTETALPSLRRPLFAIPGAIMAIVVATGLLAGPAMFSTATPEANEILTSAAIDIPHAVDTTAGIPAVGVTLPAPVPLRVNVPERRPSRVVKPKPPRPSTRARRTVRATAATAESGLPSNEPRFHGTLSISSDPLGALVWVNGELVGPTPVVLKKVAAGSVVVRIESGGYERWSYAARVVANKETSILASLQRASGH